MLLPTDSSVKGIFDQDICVIFHSSKSELCAAHHGLIAHNAAAIKQLFPREGRQAFSCMKDLNLNYLVRDIGYDLKRINTCN